MLERIQKLRLVHQTVDRLLVLPLPLKGAEEAVPDDQGPGVVLVLHTCKMQKYSMVLVNWFWGALFPRTSDPIFHESLFFHPIPLHGYVPRPFISISLSPGGFDPGPPSSQFLEARTLPTELPGLGRSMALF